MGSSKPRVVFSHDWLNGMRGGEKCLEAFCRLFPDAPIYTLFYEKGKVSKEISSHRILSSYLEHFPGVYKNYRYFLPFFPSAVRSFKVEGHDFLISTSHCVAKGLKKDSGAKHVCYCFTPVRYAWSQFEQYFGTKNPLWRWVIRQTLEGLKAWDLKSNAQVDYFVAISEHVRGRIRQFYDRDAQVIYPPVDTDFYTADSTVRKDFYLIVSALVPYKKIDLAVRLFNDSGKKLIVIGDGPEKNGLMKMAKSNIEWMGWRPDEVLRKHYRTARALIFPGEEDFGIIPVEAQACGCPVIALGQGGALETVVEGKTGIFFKESSLESLELAVGEFEKNTYKAADCRENALRFSYQRFLNEIQSYLNSIHKRV